MGENLRTSPEQLRLIVIYTGALDLLTVADKVRERIKSVASATVEDGDFAFQTGAMRIVILGKPNRYRTPEQQKQQVTNDSELCAARFRSSP